VHAHCTEGTEQTECVANEAHSLLNGFNLRFLLQTNSLSLEARSLGRSDYIMSVYRIFRPPPVTDSDVGVADKRRISFASSQP